MLEALRFTGEMAVADELSLAASALCRHLVMGEAATRFGARLLPTPAAPEWWTAWTRERPVGEGREVWLAPRFSSLDLVRALAQLAAPDRPIHIVRPADPFGYRFTFERKLRHGSFTVLDLTLLPPQAYALGPHFTRRAEVVVLPMGSRIAEPYQATFRALPDLSSVAFEFDAEPGSIKFRGKLFVFVSTVYFGIGQYGDFRTGLTQVWEDIRWTREAVNRVMRETEENFDARPLELRFDALPDIGIDVQQAHSPYGVEKLTECIEPGLERAVIRGLESYRQRQKEDPDEDPAVVEEYALPERRRP